MQIQRIFPKGEIFHICNKSISNYQIFRKQNWIERFLITINYYNNSKVVTCLSKALRKPMNLDDILGRYSSQLVHILAYCVMPDHYHLLVKVNNESGLSKYMGDVENSYTRYFNKLNRRKGPLWQSRFRATYIEDSYTLLHVHRYIHLNPTTASLVTKPEEYKWSSYQNYINSPEMLNNTPEISIQTISYYRKFVENQIDYQKTIKGIRRTLLDFHE